MKKLSAVLTAAVLTAGFLVQRARTQQAPPAAPATAPASQPATQPYAGPADLQKYTFSNSKIFPGTVRDFWVYVPTQYDASKPACLFVDQDRVQFNAPKVFDQLIAEKKIPVTIGVFVAPGVVPPPEGANALPRYNRSFEFDGMSSDYVTFLITELLPEVEKKTTKDGRAIKLSSNPNDRAIGGSSSGAIAAFTAAWEGGGRPDSFNRVFSAIGTYVDLRSGNDYPSMIRKFEPRPIRIYLQDGSNDNNHYGGDWWMANQEMERALIFAGYEVNHVWGTGKHEHKQADEIFPEAMTWLWQDWPNPVKKGAGSEKLQDILIPGEDWQLVGEGYGGTDGPIANAKGEVFFATRNSKTMKVALDGSIREFQSGAKIGGQAFGPDGKLYAVSGTQILAFDDTGKSTLFAEGFKPNDLIISNAGNMYVTESLPALAASTQPATTPAPSNVWFIDKTGNKKIVDTGLKFANGICFSPDQTLLYVADYRSHWVYSYQIQSDGTLNYKQRYYRLWTPDAADDSAADGIHVDRDGRLYVSTRVGVQVCDQAGRVNAIIPTPNGKVAGLCFGGEGFNYLYTASGDRVYRRKLKPAGVNAFEPPIKPAPPKL